MPTTAQHIAARDDADLTERVRAVAEMEDQPGAQQWAEANMGRVVNVVVGEEQTLSQVYAYAASEYGKKARNDTGLAPGADPAIVTDDHIRTAVQAVRTEDANQGSTA